MTVTNDIEMGGSDQQQTEKVESSPTADSDSADTITKEQDNQSEDEATTVTTSASSSPAGTFRDFYTMAKPELPMLSLALFLMFTAEAASLIIPIIIARAYNAVIDPSLTTDDRSDVIDTAMITALSMFAASLAIGWIRTALQGIAGERAAARLRLNLYSSVLHQEVAFFDECKSGEIVSRLGSDATLLQLALAQSLPEVANGLVKSVVALSLMFYLSAKLAALSIGGVVLIFAASMPIGKRMGAQSKAYQDVLGEAQTHSTEAIGSMRTVQAFAAEEKELGRYRERIGDPALFGKGKWMPKNKDKAASNNSIYSQWGSSTYQIGFHKAITTSSFFTLVFGGGFGFLYVTLWYGFHLVNGGSLTLGDLTAFQTYVFTIGFGVGQAAANMAKIFEGVGASGRIFHLVNRVPAIPQPRAAHDPEPLKPSGMEGGVEFHNVGFTYASRPDAPVLQNYSLSIPPNTATALVGSSGAGKSTVVGLLQRFYDISAGSITIDGRDITTLDLQWLRHKIGYVQQEPHLFGLSVRENLLYGVEADRVVSQKELEQVCMDAHAHGFISAMPQGYDTLVGERGIKLSGGQKQRIAIARALLTDCRILLLDEATSALDAESEHLVQEAIEKATVGRTVIIVAHRLSTIRRADQIVVMDDRKIVDVGSHVDLLQKCGRYRDLIKRQSVASVAIMEEEEEEKTNKE